MLWFVKINKFYPLTTVIYIFKFTFKKDLDLDTPMSQVEGVEAKKKILLGQSLILALILITEFESLFCSILNLILKH